MASTAPFSLAAPDPKNKGSEESLYMEVWRCWNVGGTNQIAAFVAILVEGYKNGTVTNSTISVSLVTNFDTTPAVHCVIHFVHIYTLKHLTRRSCSYLLNTIQSHLVLNQLPYYYVLC